MFCQSGDSLCRILIIFFNFFKVSSVKHLVLFGLIIILSLDAQPLKVSIQAQSAILLNPATGAVLFEKNADASVFPASTLKIATALFALEGKKIPLDTPIIISEKAISKIPASVKQAAYERYPSYLIEHDGTMIGLKKGERIPFQTLLYGLMMLSGNDAANAIAEHCSGSIEQFMEEMNTYLKGLGLENTHLTNPHGLHHPDQKTTARDFARLAGYALKNGIFRQVVGNKSFESSSGRRFTQRNRLLQPGPYFYQKAIGVKTGYTSHAGFNVVAAAEDRGRLLVAVLFGCANNEQRYKEAIALFEAAFKEKQISRTLFAKECETFNLVIPCANKPLKAQLIEDLTIHYFPAEECQLRSEIIWKQLKLPIQPGQLVGCVKVVNEQGQIVAAAALHAMSLVNFSFFHRCLHYAGYSVPGLLLPLLLLIQPLRQRCKFLIRKLFWACLRRDLKRL